MQIERPPRLPTEQFKISKEKAIETTKAARQKLFEVEKDKTYHAIHSAADKGSYSVEYTYPENCNREDIELLHQELINNGFKVKFEGGIKDSLEISWYE